jgi:hypothetical protein
MNLLPGLRELRAPLAAGYLWLASAWLALGSRLPVERPLGKGEVARLWDLGGAVGKTTVLAVVSFAAYLIGSFLEIDPDGRIVNSLTPIVLRDHRPSYMKPEQSEVFNTARASLDEEGFNFSERKAETVARSISGQAKRDLIDVFQQQEIVKGIATDPDEPRVRWQRMYRVDEMERVSVRLQGEEKGSRGKGSPRSPQEWDELWRRQVQSLKNEMAIDMVLVEIVQEMRQLASRLLVKNKELYGRYDRQMAEASLRLNISIPLTVLLLLGIWLSGLPFWPKVALTLVSLGFGFMLLRQGFLRALSARDVIVQALVIGQVESRHISLGRLVEGPAGEPAGSKEPVNSEQKPGFLAVSGLICKIVRQLLDRYRRVGPVKDASGQPGAE